MKNYLFVVLFFFIINCSNSKSVYWCGDHPCINKKEKESYFKKTMTVEVKDLKKNNYEDKSEIEILLQQSQKDEEKKINKKKESIKQIKLEKKIRIKEKKELAKQTKIEEKRRIKKQKELAKQAKVEEKRKIKEEKELAKKIELDEDKQNKNEKRILNKKVEKKRKKITEKNVELVTSMGNVEINLNKFGKLVEKITKKNSFRPYPDINDIPN